jgi:exonuclease III
MKILSLNTRSLNKKQEEIERLLKSSNIDVFLCQETWHQENKKLPTIQGYKHYGKHIRTKVGGGVAIYTRRQLKKKQIHFSAYDGKIEICAILLKKDKDYIIGCVYAPPNLGKNAFEQLEDLEFPNADGILLAGDFNI